jgi:hypothetical protein
MGKHGWKLVLGGASVAVAVALIAVLAVSALAAPNAATRLSVGSTEFGKALFGPSGKVLYVLL